MLQHLQNKKAIFTLSVHSTGLYYRRHMFNELARDSEM